MIAFAYLLTFIGYDVLSIRKSVIKENLDIAFGDSKTPKEKKTIARKSFLSFMMTCLEVMRSVRFPFYKSFGFIDTEIARNALKDGKGALLIAMHMGNWEALGSGLNVLAPPVRSVVKKVGGKGTNEFIVWLRERNKFLTVSRDKKNGMAVLKAIKESLAQNQIFGFPMDQYKPGDERIPFFGKDTATNTGLATIAKKYSANVLVSYCIRQEFGAFRMIVEEMPVFPNKSTSKETKIASTLLVNQKIEEIVRKYPEQYFWLHRRWK